MLDMAAALLSAGLAIHQIPADPLAETRVSQVFLAFDLKSLGGAENAARIADDIIENLHAAGCDGVRYPGERTLQVRRENLENGIPVDAVVWEQVRKLS